VDLLSVKDSILELIFCKGWSLPFQTEHRNQSIQTIKELIQNLLIPEKPGGFIISNLGFSRGRRPQWDMFPHTLDDVASLR